MFCKKTTTTLTTNKIKQIKRYLKTGIFKVYGIPSDKIESTAPPTYSDIKNIASWEKLLLMDFVIPIIICLTCVLLLAIEPVCQLWALFFLILIKCLRFSKLAP